MRVGFAGTPAFAATTLEAIVGNGFDVALVLTQPDRPKGRGLKLSSSAVKQSALRHALPVLQPVSLRDDHDCSMLRAIPLDVLIVAAYGLLLPQAILAWPRLGCINVHASLLPRWRGAAPMQRALLAGDSETGITLMQLDAGLDTGPLLQSVHVPIAARDTAGTLSDKLAQVGAQSVIALLDRMGRGEMPQSTPQATQGATYAPKIEAADTLIDWHRSAQSVDRQVRALAPTPGASTWIERRMLKIRVAAPVSAPASSAAPGTVVAASGQALVVACGEDALELIEVQPAGGKSMSARAFAAGHRIQPGTRFASKMLNANVD